ncbi:MFS transporter [Enterobacter sp. Ap-1006]|uniref:MFS transporter n=1 Tax=Enterobacter sp. Ap-1006 TaxID=2608345 RepID=UPI0019628205|nr:MFS transporter [Enterobacter sp. Ap-1006]
MMAVTRSHPSQEQLLTLVAVCLASITMPFNFTAAAVALPAIGQSFHGSSMAVNWVANAFMLTFGSCLMLAGALADSYGRKRMFAGGIAAFALLSASLLAAPNLFVFDLLRGAQGIAAAIAFSGGMSALAQVFDGTARMRAFSFVGCSFGIGLAFGPVAAAVMIDLFSWSIVFILLTLVAGIACFLACRYMPESHNPAANGIDWAGAVVFTWTLGVFTYAVLRVPEVGWGDAFNLALFAVATISLLVFIRIELRVQQPMLDLTLFKFPRFVGVQLLAAAPAYSFVVLLLLLPLRFVGVEGMPVLEAGRLMIALSAPLLFLPIIAGYLTRWFSASNLCGVGLLVCAAGLLWLSRIPGGASAWQFALPMWTIGCGISLPWGLMDGLAVSVVPRERAGMATGIFSTTRVAGEGIAMAIVSALLSSLMANNLHQAVSASPQRLAHVAQSVVTGDVATATTLLQGVTYKAIAASYDAAFSDLLLLLMGITLLVALVVFLFLDKEQTGDETRPQATAS